MDNMFIAAASLGIMSGWDHATVKDLFRHDPALKAELIPEGYEIYAAAFFGYPAPASKTGASARAPWNSSDDVCRLQESTIEETLEATVGNCTAVNKDYRSQTAYRSGA